MGTASASSTDKPPNAVEEVVEPPAEGRVTGIVMVPDGYRRLYGDPPDQGAKDYGAGLVCDLHDEPPVPQKGDAT